MWRILENTNSKADSIKIKINLVIKFLKRLFEYLLYTNFFISLVSTTMCYGTATIFNLTMHSEVYLIIFFSTLSSYNIHWYFSIPDNNLALTERLVWQKLNSKLILFISIFSSCIVIYLLGLHANNIKYFMPAAIATGVYTAPKIPIKLFNKLEGKALAKTTYLTLIWLYVTLILPFLLSNIKFNNSHMIYIASNFLYIYLICLLFDYRDRDKDSIKYIFINTNKYFKIIYWSLTLALTLCIVIGFVMGLTSYILIGLLLSILFLSLGYNKSINQPTDLWYYFVLDGLMMLPAIITLTLFVLFAPI